MTSIKLNKSDNKRHLLFWGFLTTYFFLFDLDNATWYANVVSGVLNIATYVITYYFLSLRVFPKYWSDNRNKAYLLLTLNLITFVSIFHLNNNILFNFLDNEGWLLYFPTTKYIVSKITFFLVIAFCAFSFYGAKLRLHLATIQNEREQALMLQEMNFFQNQFNSHITLNFLSYCYGNAHKVAPSVAEGIDLYSTMLRYSLGSNIEKKVLLKKEIEYIESFIELKKLLSKNVQVNFSSEIDNKECELFPRLLIPFVENAFKHGVSTNDTAPIEIKLELNNKQLIFSVKNHKKKVKNRLSTGIGITNVKQTLELYYKENYELNIDSQADTFFVQLQITL